MNNLSHLPYFDFFYIWQFKNDYLSFQNLYPAHGKACYLVPTEE